MTETEFLMKESGLTAEEWKAYEALGTTAKLLQAVKKAMGLSEQALKDKVDAENARLAFEKRYSEEFVPELKRVTQDSLRAQGDLAAAQARLKAAEDYGLVVPGATPPAEPPRAPGSQDPNALTRDDLGRFSAAQSRTIIALNDIGAEHFRLTGTMLADTQGLVDEVTRQHMLGNKGFTLKQAWETREQIPQKRQELEAKALQKKIDDAIAADRKTRAEATGSNPNTRSGQTSRFSSYKPNDAAGGKEPWKASHSVRERNADWRKKSVEKIRAAMVN